MDLSCAYPKPLNTPSRARLATRGMYPVHPPPEPLKEPPALPSPPRTTLHDVAFTVTTHIVPAAYIRSTPVIPPPVIPDTRNKTGRYKALEKILDNLSEIRERTTSTRPPQGYPRVLWNCVNRYLRNGHKPRGNGLTLFFTHANGFFKEIWEPTLQYLLTSEYRDVDEVWSFEAVQHGDSALLNKGSLGATYDWTDNARDIANFLVHFLPTSASMSPLPTVLPRISAAESEARKKHGFQQRTLISVGHSFGGCTMTLAALAFPKLFSALILVDPVILYPGYYEEDPSFHNKDFALGALLRSETWRSRGEAKEQMGRNPFFASWDPAVLQVYVDHGTYTHADGVSLKTSKVQEAISFLDKMACYEVWDCLKDVNRDIYMHWVMPEKGHDSPEDAQERVWRREINSSNVILPGTGHLIPHEAPRECARAIQMFISEKYPGVGVRVKANL